MEEREGGGEGKRGRGRGKENEKRVESGGRKEREGKEIEKGVERGGDRTQTHHPVSRVNGNAAVHNWIKRLNKRGNTRIRHLNRLVPIEVWVYILYLRILGASESNFPPFVPSISHISDYESTCASMVYGARLNQ